MGEPKKLNEEELKEISGGVYEPPKKVLVCSKCSRNMSGKRPGARCSNDKNGCPGIAVYMLVRKE